MEKGERARAENGEYSSSASKARVEAVWRGELSVVAKE